MTAGRGITHSERFEKARAEGGSMHGIQAWVALPEENEETEPGFAHYGGGDLPLVTERDLTIRVIAGSAFGHKARVKTHSPMFYAHVEMQPEGTVEAPAEYSERAAYVATGMIEAEGEKFSAGQMLLFKSGAPAALRATEHAIVMLLGGEPLGPRHIEWNFVSSSKERIEQAKADWRAGRMKLPDFDNREFIPLPGDPPPPPNPMS